MLVKFSPPLPVCGLVPCEVRKQKIKRQGKGDVLQPRPCAFSTRLHATNYTLVLIMRRLKINMATEYFLMNHFSLD